MKIGLFLGGESHLDPMCQRKQLVGWPEKVQRLIE
jgi:hypothetical protein